MNIEIKILKFFLLSKESGREYNSLVTLDRYLVHTQKETKFLGSLLSDKIQELLKKRFIQEDKQKFSITKKGIDYLNQHS
jgi:hypothetical protein